MGNYSPVIHALARNFTFSEGFPFVAPTKQAGVSEASAGDSLGQAPTKDCNNSFLMLSDPCHPSCRLRNRLKGFCLSLVFELSICRDAINPCVSKHHDLNPKKQTNIVASKFFIQRSRDARVCVLSSVKGAFLGSFDEGRTRL